MELVKVSENALTVELDWADCSLLAHLIKRALSADALYDAPEWSMAHGYARTLVALLEAGGMATWAYTCTREEFPLTREDCAKEAARLSAAPAPDGQPDDTAPPV